MCDPFIKTSKIAVPRNETVNKLKCLEEKLVDISNELLGLKREIYKECTKLLGLKREVYKERTKILDGNYETYYIAAQPETEQD